MIRSITAKVAWVGRTASMVFGLALVLALVLGATSVALAGNLDPLKIGSIKNVATKTTQLVGKVVTGEALVVKNPSGGPALGLSVGDPLADPATKTVAPMKVDSQAKVSNFNADTVDGKSSEELTGAHLHAGEDVASGTVEADRIEDGAGSNLDADQLDGKDSTAFADKAEASGFDHASNTNFQEVGDTVKTIGTVTVTSPAEGYVILTADGVFINHNVNGDYSTTIHAFLASFDTSFKTGDTTFHRLPSNLGGDFNREAHASPFNITRVVPVQAGERTFYLKSYNEAQQTGGLGIDGYRLTGVFVKNRL